MDAFFATPPVLLAIPVVDIDNTVFVQAGIFLVLLVVLKPLLFDPWLKVQDMRFEKIEGAFDASKKLRVQADELGEDYTSRMDAARDRAISIRSDRRREGEAEQAKTIAEARKVAGAELDAQRERIAKDVETAKADLEGRVSALAKDIAEKVLGRVA